MARRACEREDAPKYEATIYGYKCGESTDTNASSSPIPSPQSTKDEQRAPAEDLFAKDAAQQYSKSGHADGEHSDNGSEVSDEGYRSLGAVQPAITTGTTNIGNQHQDASTALQDSHSQSCNRSSYITQIG